MKQRILVPVLLVIALVVVLLVLLKQQNTRDLNEILSDGRITVLIDSGEHGFTRDSAKVAGFQYEVVKMFADELGVELVILQEPDHAKGNKELADGDCDIVVSLQPLINDSASSIVSVYPLLETNLMLVQLPDSAGKLPVTTQHQLDGKPISLIKASPFKEVLLALAEDLAIEPEINETGLASLDAMIQSIVTKTNKYTVCPEYLSKRLKRKYPQADFSLPLTFYLQLAWTVRDSSPVLKQQLDTFITDFVGTANYWSMYNTYFMNE